MGPSHQENLLVNTQEMESVQMWVIVLVGLEVSQFYSSIELLKRGSLCLGKPIAL